MRVYKPTYTKLLPEGAKIFICKRGRHESKKFAKFKDAKGHTTEARLAKDGNKILLETTHWHISFEDNLGIRRELKAFTNEQASKKLADRIVELLCCQANNQQLDIDLQKWLEQIPCRIRNELIRFGLLDAEQTAAGKSLEEHIEDYRNSLLAKERSPNHIKTTIGSIRRTFANCGCRAWSDISAEKIETYLASIRDDGKGISCRTSNFYLKAAKSFCYWMVKTQRSSSSPLKYLKALNVELDQRRKRRALEPDEIRRLLEATQSEPERFGMTGYERALLYRVAIETGMRRNELRSLTVASFDFKNRKVTVEAVHSKNRKQSTLPLRPDTAAQLKQFFKGKTPAVQAFNLWDKSAKMLQADLKAAKIPYIDDVGRYVDFHSLRYTTGSLLAASGVHPKVAQSIMRHSDINLTMGIYTHTLRGQESEAVESLPDLSLPSREKQKAVATGTYDANVTDKSLSKSCFSGAQQ